jgi:rubrerythrin
MSRSEEHLKEAFAGESQANRTYLAFAKAAAEEGHPQVGRLFRAAAEAETVHALNHLRVMNGVKSTRENLQEAISGETFEFTEMYPQMIETAKAEGKSGRAAEFRLRQHGEKVHAKLFKDALELLGEQTEEYSYYVCRSAASPPRWMRHRRAGVRHARKDVQADRLARPRQRHCSGLRPPSAATCLSAPGGGAAVPRSRWRRR